MAESEQKDSHSSPAPSSPESHSVQGRELKAPKDRNCPFCGQAFTSSSLGRHLDLYIKPKNPKPPDGVHDVNEIRKIRGGITRRQPRTSLKTGEREGDGHRREDSRHEDGGHERPAKAARFTDSSYVNSPVEKEGGIHTFFNAPVWQATGVINDLPARAPSRSQNTTPNHATQAQRLQDMRRDGSGNRIERPDYVPDDMWKLQEAAEVGKAAEMALREVLGSLEAARKKTEPKQLYDDFDYMALSFPALCLAILPPPPSLFSTPFAGPQTWSLEPPQATQFEALNRMLNERSAWVRNGNPDNLPDSVIFRCHVHLERSYEHWQTMSDKEQQNAWVLELSRALVGEKGKKQDLKAELERAQQRVKHLEAEFDRLSRCQLPREYLLHPPNTIPINENVLREMRSADDGKSAAAKADYDAEVLLEKWRSRVKSTARSNRMPASSNTLTATYPPQTYVETRRNQLRSDMYLNGSVFSVGGPMPRDSIGLRDRGGVTYETPREPGGVINEDIDLDPDADWHADADGDVEDDAPLFTGRHAGTMTRTRRAGANGSMNANGKRPLDSATQGGRKAEPRLSRGG
jgi:hypothetical protein